MHLRLRFSRMTRLASIFALQVLLVSSGVTSEKEKEIDRLLQKYHDQNQLDGAVLVAEHGKVIYKNGFGFANREWRIRNTAETKFRLASITKQFTSMLVMQLVQDGELTLDGKISDYLPSYREDTGSRVTIHHLLTHTSGIPSYTNQPGFMQNETRNPYEPMAFVEKFCSGDLEFEPGSTFRYNNSGYFLLGAIIEQVSGKNYEDLLRERIFTPLGMRNSGYDHFETVLPNRAAGYNRTVLGFQNAPYLDMSIPYAAGSLYSTVEDLFRWDRALYTEQLLSAGNRDLMFTAYENGYGYGWRITEMNLSPERSVKAIAHNGGIFGFNTTIVRLVEDEHLIVILRNAPGASIDGIAGNIAAILYDQPYEMMKTSAAETIAKTMLTSGVEEGLAQYRNLKQYHHQDYDFSEGDFNSIGYQLLGSKKYDEAIALFQLNVSSYPQSANTYDSLAEAYLTTGDRAKALENYRQVLEKLPDDPNIDEAFSERLRKNAEEKIRELSAGSNGGH